MKHANLVKALGLIASVIGMGATLLSDYVNEKMMEEKINERIDERMAELNGRKEDEEP